MPVNILHVVGARPNFVKIAPIYKEIAGRSELRQTLVHTGQHYDDEMSGIFFEEFALPAPDHNLEVGSASHAVQTADIMKRFEPVLDEVQPDWVVVVGDVNSTVAATLVAVKKGIRTAHVEAGLRSGDWSMPEEINRMLTDRICHLLLTPSRDADENLLNEGIEADRIAFVGNVMIDTLVTLLPRANDRFGDVAGRLGLPGRYGLVTLHRPSNVDDPDTLAEIAEGLRRVADDIPLVFPIHPRTRSRLQEFDVSLEHPGLHLVDPIGYVEFIGLTANATMVVTDSGGIQEETTYLGIPCLTVRPNTERPVTITQGTNRLVHSTADAIASAAAEAMGRVEKPARPQLWDGRTAERVVDAIEEHGERR